MKLISQNASVHFFPPTNIFIIVSDNPEFLILLGNHGFLILLDNYGFVILLDIHGFLTA